MINIMIRNARNEYLEYSYDVETKEEAMAMAIETYIETRLRFNSTIFPVTQEFWTAKIKAAVAATDVLNLQDKVELLNSICRKYSLKITKIFANYSIEYPEELAAEVESHTEEA
jgi:hypothetical protein